MSEHATHHKGHGHGSAAALDEPPGATHIIPVRTYLVIFGVLMALLFATVAGAYMPFPTWAHLPVAMTIAIAKAALIIMYFMHVRFSSRLTVVFSTAAFFWLILLLVFCLQDYASRDWLAIEGK
jgi:cytochrome c oxidase subunit IV